MLKLFGSPRKAAADTRQSAVPSLEGSQAYNPYTPVTILSHHAGIVRHLKIIDDTRLASAGDDTTIVIWLLQTSERVHVLKEHSRPVTCLYVIPGDITAGDHSRPGVLLSSASDKIICIWNPVAGTLLRRLTDHQSTARCFLSVASSSCFCSGGEKLCLWSLEDDLITSLERSGEEDISQMIEIRDSRLVVSVDKRPVVYYIRKTDEGTTLSLNRKLAPHREAITALLKISDACFVSGSLDGTIVLWSAQALAPSRYFNSISDYLGDNRVLPYSIQSMVCLEERYLVCAIGAGFSIYDIIPGRLVAQRRLAHYSKILSLALVYNSTLLATTSEDGSIRLWGCIKTFTQKTAPNVNRSFLDRLLGIGPGDAKLLKDKNEKIEPQLLGECLGHNGAVRVCVNSDGHGMLTCGADGIIINWKDGLYESMKANSRLQDFYNNLNGPHT